MNANFASGETPLSVSVANKWNSLVEILLLEKASVNGRLSDGRTSLHVAAEVGSDSSVITLLCEYGADPSLGDETSWTPLHYAAHYGHEEVALMLIEDDQSKAMFERNGWTPLHAAVEQEHTDIIQLFARFAKTVSKISFKSSYNRRERHQVASARPPLSSSGKAIGTALDAPQSSSHIEGDPDPAEEPSASSSARRLPQSDARPPRSRAQSPLFLATSQEYLAGVDILVKAGVALDDALTCIKLALTKGNVVLLEKLTIDSERRLKLLLSRVEWPGKKNRVALSPNEVPIFSESLFKSFR